MTVRPVAWGFSIPGGENTKDEINALLLFFFFFKDAIFDATWHLEKIQTN